MNATTTVAPTTMHASHSAWHLHEISLSSAQILIANELFDWLARQPVNLAHSLIQGASGNFSATEMRVLEHEIIKHFAPLPNAEHYLKVLCKVIDGINSRSALKLPTPRVPHLIHRPKNPFSVGWVDALNKSRKWRAAISTDGSLGRNKPSIQSTQNLGLLFSSAILHGGLVDANLLISLARALAAFPVSSFLLDSNLVIQLSVSWQGEAASEYRLWYPDPLTGTLIPKLIKNNLPVEFQEKANNQGDKDLRTEIWNLIRRHFQTIGLSKSERPTSLGMMLETVRMDFQSRLPIVLTSYANRSLISHSVPLSVIERLCKVVKPKFNQPPPKPQCLQQDSTDLITDQNQASMDMVDIEPYWLTKYRHTLAIRKKSMSKIQIELAQINPEPDTPEHCYRDFAIHLVSSRSASGNMLAPSTASSYLVMVAKRLGGRLGNVNPTTLSVETLEDLYKEILEDADPDGNFRGARRRIAKALREFHHYLVLQHKIDSINVREVLGIGKGLLPVDANLITWDEFETIKAEIPNTLIRLHPTFPATTALGKALQLIFMLSFKCGLRRMEVLMLTCADFGEHDPAELLIRPSDARRLKTKSSTRKLPLYALLDESDIDELRQWKVSRLATGTPTNSHENFLFCIPKMGTSVITQDMVFPIIHEAMRSVTGDDSLHFHHLRHSFASWTFMRLMMSDMPTIPDLFTLHPKTSAILSDSMSFRTKLYARDCMTRRHTFAVASLLGHSGPEISMEHYIHICDILLNLALCLDESAPQKKLVRIQSGRPRSTVYRWLSEGPHHVPYRMTRRTEFFSVRKSSVTSPKPQNPATGTSTATGKLVLDPDIFNKVWDMLFQHTFHGEPLIDLCQSNGIPLEAAKKMLGRAIQISEMRSKTGSKGYRHHMMKLVFDRRDPTSLTRIPCPEPPHTQQEKEIIASLVGKLVTLMRQNPDLCQRVFSYYIEYLWVSQGIVVFKKHLYPEPARDFIKFMESLGIKKSRLKTISFDPAERSESIAQWRIMLNLSARHPVTKINNGKINVRAKKWLCMMPLFPSDPHNKAKGEEKGSNAFRYLMVMGAIIMAGLQSVP